ncbi:uncharacterized protein LOC134536051 [Bacillus rossius redtenbacheri]|uniref:uncharacterized protein LOC134536051 n=1 Tax=Bacillus rossius redtenbacheri TaxID=93214 RepID=UPI002FDD30B1
MATEFQTILIVACLSLTPSSAHYLPPGWGTPATTAADGRDPWVKCSADTPTNPGSPGEVSCLGNTPQQPFAWQQLPGGLPPVPLYLPHHHHFSTGGKKGCSVERPYHTHKGDGTLKCSAVSEKKPVHAPFPVQQQQPLLPLFVQQQQPLVPLPSSWPWGLPGCSPYYGLPVQVPQPLPFNFAPVVWPGSYGLPGPVLC